MWHVPHLAIGSTALDELLEGGLEGGAITLLFGEAGTGKTIVLLHAFDRARKERQRIPRKKHPHRDISLDVAVRSPGEYDAFAGVMTQEAV